MAANSPLKPGVSGIRWLQRTLLRQKTVRTEKFSFFFKARAAWTHTGQAPRNTTHHSDLILY